jgi:UDP-glucose 4-epimerase
MQERSNMQRSVLVTGGAGFIGSNLVRRLLEKGFSVRVLDNFIQNTRHYLEKLDLEIIEGDIRDKETVLQAARGSDVIIHLAAFGSVVDSVTDPFLNFEVNVKGTLNVLDSAVKAGVKKLIFASTGGALIGNATPPVSEQSLPKPISPYGASKLCGEGYCHAFSSSYGLQTVSLRFANVYGPNSGHKKGAITAFIKALLRDEPIVIYGDGSASRDFLYVTDLCQGILLAVEKEFHEVATVLHLASGVETTISQLANSLISISTRSRHQVIFKPARPGEVERNFAEYRLAREVMSFEPHYMLQDGLRLTWEWYKDL